MATALITHPACRRHEMGSGHPERPARLSAIADALAAAGLAHRLLKLDAPAAEDEQLLRVHAPAYLRRIIAASPETGLVALDPDTALNPHSLIAARHAAGAVVAAVDGVVRGELTNAFCAVRPPGHHACRERAMGFCIFNNVAVGAAHALTAHGLTRVAIVDFDVHHGNGTEEIFHDDPRVLLASSFQHPFYPFSGAHSGNAHILPMPLPAGTDGRGFRHVWETVGLPALARFAPQLILISAGFDAHRDDPLAGLMLVEADFAWLTREVLAIAAATCAGRVVSTLEGGYDLRALALSAAAHVQELASAAA
ncbi:histone deacetylase family protein [Thiobacter aerophilum]|uniref:Histone deacetylase family protein n=1 Tax=Thiobacter aerophilum TaxID=3121275 RepID=A0ABV0EIB0_9BURK